MTIDIDSDLNFHAQGDGCDPLVFIPDVNLYELEDPSIIDAF